MTYGKLLVPIFFGVAIAFASLTRAGEPEPRPRLSLFETIRLKGRIELQWQAIESHSAKQEYAEMVEKLGDVVRCEDRLHGEPRPGTVRLLALCLEGVGDYASAIAARTKAFDRMAAVHGDKHWRTSEARCELAQTRTIATLDKNELQNLEQAKVQLQQSLVLINAGRFVEAEPLAAKATAIREKLLGEQSTQFWAAQSYLALIYDRLGRLDEADRLYSQLLHTCKQQLGEQHPNVAVHMSNLARVRKQHGKFEDAISLSQAALKINKAAFGDHDPRVAESLNNLAVTLLEVGQYREPEQLLVDAMQLIERDAGKNESYLALLVNLAATHQKMAATKQAEQEYLAAIQLSNRLRGKEHPETAKLLRNFGTLLVEAGYYDRAKARLEQACLIERNVFGADHPEVAVGLNNLGMFFFETGDVAEAVEHVAEAARILEKHGHPTFAASLNNLGVICMSQREFDTAASLFHRSNLFRARTAGANNLEFAEGLNNLAAAQIARRNFDSAESLLRQSLELCKNILGEEHPHCATVWGHLGSMAVLQGDYDKAEEHCHRSVQLNTRAFGEQHPATAGSMSRLARVHYLREDFETAAPLFRRSVDSTKHNLQSTAIIQSERQQLAMAQGLRAQLDEFLSLAVAANDHQEAAYQEVLSWKGATLVRQRQLRETAADERVRPFFEELQRITSQLSTVSRTIPDPEELDTWRREVAGLTDKKEQLEVKLSEQSAAFRDAQQETTLKQLQAVLPPASVLVDYLEYWRYVPRSDENDQPHYVRNLLAFVIRREQPIELLELGSVAPLHRAIDVWRESYGQSAEGLSAGKKLQKQLWEPIAPYLKDADLVLVSADGALGRLPLAALPGQREGGYLLEDHRLAMVPVPQLLPSFSKQQLRPPARRKLLLMGDVDYDVDPQSAANEPDAVAKSRSTPDAVRGQTTFAPLPGTAGEINSIKLLYENVLQGKSEDMTLLTRARATERSFRDLAGGCHTLHMATHGFFAPPDKESIAGGDRQGEQQLLFSEQDRLLRGYNPGVLSGLAFSGANRTPEAGQDDGILTADEIASLSLDGVDLVVLSACETGLGEVAGGEGLLGVQRSFQVAGARTTVASLWEVGDLATQKLMERFYRNLWEKKMGKLDALREAQLYLLNHPQAIRGDAADNRGDKRVGPDASTASKRLSPRFWAAFSLSGDWR